MPKLEITNEDCMLLMKRYPDKYFELAIVDPPYGIGAGGKNFINSGNKFNRDIYRDNDWDKEVPKKEYWNELFRVSKNQIVWGGNYFLDFLNSTRCFLIWDKFVSEEMSYAMAELAWTSFDKNIKIFRESNKQEQRIHPTQKPVALYKWLLKNYAKEGDKILDTHLGSGSSAIACHYMGFDLTACELDKEYFEQAMERITNQTRQQTLI